jgi:hypothetical protein
MHEVQRGWAAEGRHRELQRVLATKILVDAKAALAAHGGADGGGVADGGAAARRARLERLHERGIRLGALAEEVLSGLTTHLVSIFEWKDR